MPLGGQAGTYLPNSSTLSSSDLGFFSVECILPPRDLAVYQDGVLLTTEPVFSSPGEPLIYVLWRDSSPLLAFEKFALGAPEATRFQIESGYEINHSWSGPVMRIRPNSPKAS